MRATPWIGLALALAACRQTVVLYQGGDSGTDGAGPSCPGPPIEFDMEEPKVIVALDRSSGMAGSLVAVRNALDEQTARYQKVVRFGYVDFPRLGDGTCIQCGGCAGMVSAPNPNLEAFDLKLHACDQPMPSCPDSDQRPTTAALRSCRDAFSQPEPVPVRRYVLLITNGQPDCASYPNTPCEEAQNAAGQLANNNVSTIVVAPGQIDLETADCLQGIAVYGGARANFHPAPSAADVASELAAVVRAIARDACELDLPTRIQDPDRVAFSWKGMPIPPNRNGQPGWDLTQSGFEIVLHGEWCERLIDGAPTDFTLLANCDPPQR